jgi:hypothetical protein
LRPAERVYHQEERVRGIAGELLPLVSENARFNDDPASAGYLRSSRFGTPVSTAAGVFGSGGPFALQLGARVSF